MRTPMLTYNFFWLQGLLSDVSNAESESDVDDVGLSAIQNSTDHSLLTPVHEEVWVVLIYGIVLYHN